ncbi:MAG: hypothetical protein LAQ69_30800 [Acidobacteriia bacterium]|nr:hypothetical protein [Terriglobia bacterium]
MKQRIFLNCTILVLALAATQTIVSAQETPGLEGVWFADVTAVDCQTGAVIPNVMPFRGLYMFSHDGSLTNEAAFFVPNTPRRSSGLGTWRHTQDHTYTAAFRFFRYNNLDGSFLVMRKVTTTIVLNGDHFTSMDRFQDFDANNNPISSVGSTGCNIVTAIRLQ